MRRRPRDIDLALDRREVQLAGRATVVGGRDLGRALRGWATFSREGSGTPANPHEPPTSARTPRPYDALELRPVTRSSRAATDSKR